MATIVEEVSRVVKGFFARVAPMRPNSQLAHCGDPRPNVAEFLATLDGAHDFHGRPTVILARPTHSVKAVLCTAGRAESARFTS